MPLVSGDHSVSGPQKYEVAVLVSQESQCQAVLSALGRSPYSPYSLGSMEDVAGYMHGRDKGVLIIDLDTEKVTNAMLRELKKKHPLTIIALSDEHLHPDLEESLRHYIYACLNKSADMYELLYILRSVFA